MTEVMTVSSPGPFRFQPRFRGIAWGSVAFGAALDVLAIAIGFPSIPLVLGSLGVVLGGAYLASPTWRIEVVATADALVVGSPGKVRFRLPWDEVVRVVVASASATCFVDGGTPERSLLVPGDGAPAPYDIADREQLVAAILAHVPADKVQHVPSLSEAALATSPSPSSSPTAP